MSLVVRDLHFSYGDRVALEGVAFSVESGKFCALLGLNGAGKSTLFALLTRLFVSLSGRIEVDGQDLALSPCSVLSRIGVVFQQSTLDMDLTVEQNLRYFAALHGISGKRASVCIGEVLERMEMRERISERVRDLNGGHRRRTEIARSLVHDPSLLLLDEPTVGLDAGSRLSITRHVHELCLDRGVTVFWATHLTDEVWSGDRLIILHRGRILEDGLASEIAAGGSLGEVFLSRSGGD